MQVVVAGSASRRSGTRNVWRVWGRRRESIERVRITCRDLELPTAGRVGDKSGLWEQMHTARETAAAHVPDLTAVGEVLRWTIASIEDLTR